MALPGLQLGAAAEISVRNTYELAKCSEWRFEVAFNTTIEVSLTSGTAEVFGTELAQNKPYSFSGYKGAVYTWHGCTLDVKGVCEVEYLAEETPMTSYANTHFAIEKVRQSATREKRDGPTTLIVGPENAGKTSLVKILTAYATKMGRQPIVVNLDTKEGMLSLPGSVSTASFSTRMDVERGWGSSPTSGPNYVPVKLPLVYYYGLPSAEDNSKLYKPIVSRLALAITSKIEADANAAEAGVIIDTPGIISQGHGGYDIIQHIMSEFPVSILIVLGSERLYSDMSKRYHNTQASSGEQRTVVKLAKSGGCVDRDEVFLKAARQASIKEYFFGSAKTTLSPHTQTVDFGSLKIYKIAETNVTIAHLLPGGDIDDLPEDELYEAVEPSPLMQNCILAITQVDWDDDINEIKSPSITGFVYVEEVDDKRRKMKILSPVPGRLPSKISIWGSWPEAEINLLN